MYDGATVFYTLNEIFTFILLLRIFIGYFISLKLTDYYTSSTTRVGKFYSVKWDTMMVFKIYFRDFPAQTQFSIFASAILFSTLCFWVSERFKYNSKVEPNQESSMMMELLALILVWLFFIVFSNRYGILLSHFLPWVMEKFTLMCTQEGCS